jgi:hypothetical protein
MRPDLLPICNPIASFDGYTTNGIKQMTDHIEYQSRFAYPEPTPDRRAVMLRVLSLMMDGKRRSKKEIREELGLDPDVEVTARIRDLRKTENGAWPFNDARADGPDDDGVYRFQLKQAHR